MEYPDGTVIGYGYDETGNRIEEAIVPPATTLGSVSGSITASNYQGGYPSGKMALLLGVGTLAMVRAARSENRPEIAKYP